MNKSQERVKQITQRQAIRELWHRHDLRWKLHDVQKTMYDAIMASDEEIVTIASSRRLGKSFLLCVLAIETCLKKSNQIVKYVCPKKQQVERTINPNIRDIIKDCPKEIKPEYKSQLKSFVFPNGSEIQMAGTDGGHADTIRGGYSNLWIVDEAGFCSDLEDVINSVLAPTADTTHGRGIVSSTPSKEIDHDFIQKYMLPAMLAGTLHKYTIYDNPLISERQLNRIIKRYPSGVKDQKFRREYLCEVIIDEERAVVPEFSELEDFLVKEWERPAFYDAYVGMDIGFRDLTVVLFAYYDFRNAVVVVEDEIVINGHELTTERLATLIKQTEKKLWTDIWTGEMKSPYLRICDNDPVMINDLSRLHNILFVPADKDNNELAINNIRLMVSHRQIIIHPNCRTLIHHLKNATWDKNRKTFDRVAGHHYDGVDALKYLLRHIQLYKNPYPSGWGKAGGGQDTFVPAYSNNDKPKEHRIIENMFQFQSSLKRKAK